jgi:predicted dehydrogenase
MGPYYLTSLVELLGPVVRVSGTATRSDRERAVATGPNAGAMLDVAVDTHINGLLEHRSGATSSIVMSFDVWKSQRTPIEIYGTAGTIAVPDPNGFSGAVSVATSDNREWRGVDAAAGYVDAGRGIGLADLAMAIADNRPHRASGELALHVLDIMESILVAGSEHRVVELTTTAEPSLPVALTPAKQL